MYRRTFCDENKIRFNVNSKVYGDVPFIAKVFLLSSKIYLVCGAKYYYTRDRAEQSVANPARFCDIIPVSENLCEFIEANQSRLNIQKEYANGYLLGHLLGRYRLAREMGAEEIADKIGVYINEFLNHRLSYVQDSHKIELEKFGFNVDSIQSKELVTPPLDFQHLCGLREFAIGRSLDEIESYASYLSLAFLNLNDKTQKAISRFEWELLYYFDIPKQQTNPQISRVLWDLLKMLDANFLCKHNPKLLAMISILCNDKFQNELTLPVVYLRNDAQEILESFPQKSAILVQTPLASLNDKMMELYRENESMFLDYICNKSVIVVGNSPSLLGANMGEKIDEFDIVIRFNNFVTQEFCRDTGSKTNIWCATQALNTITPKELRHFDFVISNDSLLIKTRQRQAMYLKILLSGTKFFVIESCDFLQQSNLRTLSFGLLMLLYLKHHRSKMKKLACFGFGLDEQIAGTKHYFKGDSGKFLAFHSWEKEREIYETLINSGEIAICQ